MTQQQQINLLNSIMPEIIESRDPEAVMLKCARKNSLSPAQLEKLGHVFNSMKTLVGLEKMANRGDSFSIVDVPAMLNKYSTYDPKRVLTEHQKETHKAVNKLTKNAYNIEGYDEYLKAWDFNYDQKNELPSIIDLSPELNCCERHGVNVEYNDECWHKTDYELFTDIKKASFETDVRSMTEQLDIANDLFRQAKFEAGEDITELCRHLEIKLIQNDADTWENLVMDARDFLGEEKAASVLGRIENIFYTNKVRGFEKIANINRGFKKRLAYDSTGLMEYINKIDELMDIEKKASYYIEKYNADKRQEKEASLSVLSDTFSPANTLFDQIKSIRPSKSKAQSEYEKKLDLGKRDIALQQLMLTDDIIASADPARVQDLYATIADLSPTLARDPVRIAPVLKEALQYDAVPISQLKDIVSLEKDVQDTLKKKYEVEALSKKMDTNIK